MQMLPIIHNFFNMYKFWGKVKKDHQRGKELGFPTANINLTKNIPEGIYVAYAKLGKSIYPTLTFIGKAKTFNEQKLQAETFILDFKQNIYGKWISIKLLKKIRDNKKFNSADELIKQMKIDEVMARKYFGSDLTS